MKSSGGNFHWFFFFLFKAQICLKTKAEKKKKKGNPTLHDRPPKLSQYALPPRDPGHKTAPVTVYPSRLMPTESLSEAGEEVKGEKKKKKKSKEPPGCCSPRPTGTLRWPRQRGRAPPRGPPQASAAPIPTGTPPITRGAAQGPSLTFPNDRLVMH